MEIAYPTAPELVGYVACLLVFLTFCMKRMLPLRMIAVASNIAFLIYGATAGLLPIFILHAALLPLNLFRTAQKAQEIRSINKAVEGQVEIDVLIPFMTRKRLSRDATLFRKGDVADAIYFLASGKLFIPELQRNVPPSSLVGEVGMFRPDKAHTTSVLCITDCEVYVILEDDVKNICAEHPQFGLYLTKLIASRLIPESSCHPHLQTTSIGYSTAPSS